VTRYFRDKKYRGAGGGKKQATRADKLQKDGYSATSLRTRREEQPENTLSTCEDNRPQTFSKRETKKRGEGWY